MGATWPAVRGSMPKFSYSAAPNDTEHGFPSRWDKVVKMYDLLAADNAAGALKLWEGVNARSAIRPLTIIHG